MDLSEVAPSSASSEAAEIIGAASTDEFVSTLLKGVLTATKASNAVKGSDVAYLSSFKDYREASEATQERIHGLLSELKAHVDVSGAPLVDAEGGADGADDFAFQALAEVVDELLEQVDVYLTEESEETPGVTSPTGARGGESGVMHTLKQAASISEMAKLPKPQDSPLFGPLRCGNARGTPAMPLEHPLKHQLQGLDVSGSAVVSHRNSGAGVEATDVITVREMQQQEQPQAGGGGNKGWVWVATEHALEAMATAVREDLADDTLNARLPTIAVDLEHHEHRSFQGMTCLMQLSTRKRDFIVDTLSGEVRGSLARLLGPLFSDPGILKVFHGADSDVLWLQRDFGIFLVNLFDTYHAARAVRYPSASLAHLLQRHTPVKDPFGMKHKYQLSDWRVRPLSAELLLYARCDTHYLITVQEVLVNELVAAATATPGGGGSGDRAALVAEVMRNSRDVCLRTYAKPVFEADGWMQALNKRIGVRKAGALSEEERRRVACLWDWRDATARLCDESPQFVMGVSTMIKLAQRAPASPDAVQAMCGSAAYNGKCSPIIAERTAEILECIAATYAYVEQPDQAQDTTGYAATSPVRTAGQNRGTATPTGQTTATHTSPFTFTPTMSMSAFTPVGASKVAQDSGRQMQEASPVMSTSQLYDTANWNTTGTPTPRKTVAGGGSGDSDLDGITLQFTVASPTGMGASDGDGDESDLTAPSKTSESHAIARELGSKPFLPLVPESVVAARAHASVLEATGGASTSTDDAANDHATTASTSSSIEEVASSASSGTTRPDDVTMAGSEADGVAEIPRSICEIYHISNRNRRRTKEKRQATELSTSTEDDASPGTPGGPKGDENATRKPSFDYFSGRTKKSRNTPPASGSSGGDDRQEVVGFMKSVGWPTEHVEAQLEEDDATSETSGASGGGGGTGTGQQREDRHGGKGRGSRHGQGGGGGVLSGMVAKPTVGAFNMDDLVGGGRGSNPYVDGGSSSSGGSRGGRGRSSGGGGRGSRR